jgi:hypothetical protein
MPLYNPYREYDKGIDDAYIGKEPQSADNKYMEGYARSLQLAEEEQRLNELKTLLTSNAHTATDR